MSHLLEVRGLTTEFTGEQGTVRAVDGVSFDIRARETFALLGESGSGKSVTALSIQRLLPDNARVEAGLVRLAGRDLLDLPESDMRGVRGGQIGMIFQEPMTSLNPVLTVGQQVDEALRRHTGLRGPERRRRAVDLLRAVRLPDPERRLEEYPFQLSGGMKQRAMIATALAGAPRLLIADEPTTALDVTVQAQVLTLLRDLQRDQGMAMLLITHDLGVVSETAHRVGVMYAGELVEIADRDAFFASPAHPYSRRLFAALPRRGKPLAAIPGSVPALDQPLVGCRFAARCEHAWERCRAEHPGLTDLGQGQWVRCHLADEPERRRAAPMAVDDAAPPVPEHAAAPATDALLGVQDLKVYFPVRKGLFKRVVGHVKAVDGVTLEIAPGRTLALVGESGCGKTTVGKAILRLLPVTAGRVEFGGQDWLALSGGKLRHARRAAQIVFQDPYASLDPRMVISDILEEGMAALGVGRMRAERQQTVDRLLQEVGLLPEVKYRYPHEFSGGQRQRIAIARALAVNPRLIVCDEPTSALDVSVQAQILNLLQKLQREHGLGYLFITHNLGVVEFLAHDVAVMYLGRIVETGPVEEVLRRPRHPYTRALLAAVPVVSTVLPAATDPAAARVQPGGRAAVKGEPPSPLYPPSGCHFHPRCPRATALCGRAYPPAMAVGPGHHAHCHYAQDAESLAAAEAVVKKEGQPTG